MTALLALVLAIVTALPFRAPPATFGGQATWYCLEGRSRCTAGHPASELAAAVPWSRRAQFPHGSRVRIHAGDRSVVVTVVDVCMGGSWDHYAAAFERLAPLSAGRIRIAVEVLR